MALLLSFFFFPGGPWFSWFLFEGNPRKTASSFLFFSGGSKKTHEAKGI